MDGVVNLMTVMKNVFRAFKSTSEHLSNFFRFIIIEGLFVRFNFLHIKFNYTEYTGWGKAVINSTFYPKLCTWSQLFLHKHNDSEDDSVKHQGFICYTGCQYVGKMFWKKYIFHVLGVNRDTKKEIICHFNMNERYFPEMYFNKA